MIAQETTPLINSITQTPYGQEVKRRGQVLAVAELKEVDDTTHRSLSFPVRRIVGTFLAVALLGREITTPAQAMAQGGEITTSEQVIAQGGDEPFIWCGYVVDTGEVYCPELDNRPDRRWGGEVAF